MKANKSTTGIDPKIKLSLLWIFVVLNMAYADILSFNGCNISDPQSNGGSSIAFGRFGARRISNGNCDCHDYPVLGIELQSKSLGNHHYRCI